ncbi:MAG TPA: peptidylprolyl isomerase [Terracidiphilus sp.]
MLVAVAVAAPAAAARGQAQDSAAGQQVLDRVVAVVNYQPILWSDITSEIRFSVLDPNEVNGTLTPQRALQQLVSRTLIQQQISQEEASADQPTDEEVQSRMNEVRTELPACVRMNCATDAGWLAFQETYGLPAQKIEYYLRLRMEMIRFIEVRFRQGIRVSEQETEAYYRDKLLPQYAKASQAPPLKAVAPRIEEILLEQQVNVLFDNWLDNLRKQGDVEVLDPSLESGSDGSNRKSEIE